MTDGDDLALIAEAARAAGEAAQAMRRRGLATTIKADGTPVTDADLEADRLLAERLTRARPDYGWLSEETADDPARLSRRRVFVVDPIDGTRAFLKDKPWWGVSVAVVENGRPVAGVVRAPDLDETYAALVGGGAWLNGRPIAAGAAKALEGCAMLGDKPMFAHPSWPEPWPDMRIENRNSLAYRLCLVASGAFDAALALSAKSEWDLAAADLIATEAGCRVTTHKGDPFAYNRAIPRAPSLACANPVLHRLILRRTRPIELASET